MPLYQIDQGGMTRLIYASSPQGAKNHILKEMRDDMKVLTPTPLAVATLVAEHGIKVEKANTGITLPPEQLLHDTEAEEGVTPTVAEDFENTDTPPPFDVGDDEADFEGALDQPATGQFSLSGDAPMGDKL